MSTPPTNQRRPSAADRRSRARRAPRYVRAATVTAALGVSGAAIIGCGFLPPKLGSVNALERLDALEGRWPGLTAPVRISWDEHLIPSISAHDDADAAYALGVVHAHLRATQMELFRRVSQGRLSELAGPATVDIDEAIRAIDLARAVPEIEAELPEHTRTWISAYVAGINARLARSDDRPADARALGLSFDDPWTVRDVLTFGRLASVDLNWGRWLTLAALRDETGYEDFVGRLWRFGDAGLPSFGAGQPHDLSVLTDIGRTGSNAFVIHGERSESGGALVASDPHLGLLQPNIWCVVGYRTPESAAVGLTMPGLPFVLVGRNERVAWTGTNMQSSSSVLYNLPEGWEPAAPRDERIGVRLWFDADRTIRESEFGPVISDADLLASIGDGDVALRWRGHDASDEASAFLRASRARGWNEFRLAFSSFAAGGQNILYGDALGNIGQLMAVEAVPAAAGAARIGVVDATDPAFAWTPGLPSDRLPASYNPAEGFLVSANNVPTPMSPALVPQGNANDRLARMRDLIGPSERLNLDDLARIQRDTYSHASLQAVRRIAELAAGPELAGEPASLRADLAAWDGRYETDSRGALVYHAVLSQLVDTLYADRYGRGIQRTIRSAPYIHDFVREDLGRADAERAALRALARAARRVRPGMTWGDIHELRVAHPLGAVPVLGQLYVFDRLPYRGSTSVVAKAAHPVGDDKHNTTFGANARLLVDMGTLDDNRVVLLGGQDGWIGSDRLLDMLPLWNGGGFVPLPLSAQGQAARCVAATTLRPGPPKIGATTP